MKYCQKCRVMLKDEVEVCPICGEKQLPAEEYEAKLQNKKKSTKTLIIVIAAVLAVFAAAIIVIMNCRKAPAISAKDEVFTEKLENTELQAQFAAYVAAAIPAVWEGSDEDTDSAIEYYSADFPNVAAGFEQMKEIKPLVGEIKSISFSDFATTEDGQYKLVGELVCTNGKVKYELVLGASGYVDGLSFEIRELPVLEKARDFLLEYMPE